MSGHHVIGPGACDTDRMSVAINDPSVIRALLTTPATWAVVGLSENRARAAYGVARFLDGLGMRIVPIHPTAPVVLGWPGHAALADVPQDTRIDVVDCFVNSDQVGSVVDEAIAQRHRLGIGAIWLQLGVVDEAAAARALDAGLSVVMDTCPAIEHPRLGR